MLHRQTSSLQVYDGLMSAVVIRVMQPAYPSGTLPCARAPVHDAPHEGGDERRVRLRAPDGMREGEEQRHVALDALLLQHLRAGKDCASGCSH